MSNITFFKISKKTNEFSLKILGAGGGVFAFIYAIPNAMLKQFCSDSCYGTASQSIHLIISVIFVFFITINAIHQYHLSGVSNFEIPTVPSQGDEKSEPYQSLATVS